MRSILLRIRGIAVFNRTRPKGELARERGQKKGVYGLPAIGIEADTQRQNEGKKYEERNIFLFLIFGSVLAR